MQTKHRTVFRSKNILLLVPVTIFFFCGCISYQMIKSVEGTPVASPNGIVLVGKTTLGDALSLFGVPDQVLELEGKNLIIYERILYCENALTIGIPVMGEIGGPSADVSARGGLARYDTLALFFTPDDILCNIVYEKGSLRPYLKTLLSDTQKNP